MSSLNLNRYLKVAAAAAVAGGVVIGSANAQPANLDTVNRSFVEAVT
jgi:hypothetical protein